MLNSSEEQQYLDRIEAALAATSDVARGLANHKTAEGSRQETIRNAERQISDALREALVRPGEGWLCEEDADDQARLGCDVAWVIDPVDGTQEFITGVPEWSISVGLVVPGNAVGGGVFNPSTEELVLGSRSCGVTYNGAGSRQPANPSMEGRCSSGQPTGIQPRRVAPLRGPRFHNPARRAQSPTSWRWLQPDWLTRPGRSHPSTSGTLRQAWR